MSYRPRLTRDSRACRVLRDERGLTLTELTIVGLLAIIVMFALTAFYFNSQQLWIDGSTQALAQRDATLLVDEMRRSVHEATEANVPPGDPIHAHLSLRYENPARLVEIYWNASDSRVHRSIDAHDTGPIVDTPVSRFIVTPVGVNLVELTLAELRTANGDSVRIASRFALLGR